MAPNTRVSSARAHPVRTNARRAFIALLMIGLAVAAYYGWLLFTTEPA